MCYNFFDENSPVKVVLNELWSLGGKNIIATDISNKTDDRQNKERIQILVEEKKIWKNKSVEKRKKTSKLKAKKKM